MTKEGGDHYVGVAGGVLEIDQFDLGNGVTVSSTYAHLMAPFLMAFAPAEPGKPHPAPWVAVSGGLGFDIHVQIHTPRLLETTMGMTPEFVSWWIMALLRLRIGPHLTAPVSASDSFSAAKSQGSKVCFRLIEIEPRFLDLSRGTRSNITEIDLAWVRHHWVCSATLAASNEPFSLLMEAVDQCVFARHTTLALLWLWGGLESLFSPAKAELRYRISSMIACYLESAGLGRMSLQKSVAKLYDSRSEAAHGGRDYAAESLLETYALGRRVVLKIIEEGRVPTHTELEARLFGADPS